MSRSERAFARSMPSSLWDGDSGWVCSREAASGSRSYSATSRASQRRTSRSSHWWESADVRSGSSSVGTWAKLGSLEPSSSSRPRTSRHSFASRRRSRPPGSQRRSEMKVVRSSCSWIRSRAWPWPSGRSDSLAVNRRRRVVTRHPCSLSFRSSWSERGQVRKDRSQVSTPCWSRATI